VVVEVVVTSEFGELGVPVVVVVAVVDPLGESGSLTGGAVEEEEMGGRIGGGGGA